MSTKNYNAKKVRPNPDYIEAPYELAFKDRNGKPVVKENPPRFARIEDFPYKPIPAFLPK